MVSTIPARWSWECWRSFKNAKFLVLFELGQKTIDAFGCAIEGLLRINPIAYIFERREKDIFQLEVTWRHRAKHRAVTGFVDS